MNRTHSSSAPWSARASGTAYAATIVTLVVVLYHYFGVSDIVRYYESLYYRYWGSLGWLYHPNAAFIVPPGQLSGVIDNILNAALTTAGYPPFDRDVFFDRVSLFCFLVLCAHAVCLLLAINALLAKASTVAGAFLVCAAALLPFFGIGWFGLYEFLRPDYEPFLLFLYLWCASVLVKLIRTGGRTNCGARSRLASCSLASSASS